ncbi:hypothetical protein FQA39_LY16696 [Lamprigera yunnana]|nr:hypothetical protein FQA39_LY16696 [Lamprigera yunnana]
MPERVDIVIFGATGVTGEYTAPYVYRLAKEKGLTWGVGGRSEQKLNDVLKRTADRVGVENLNDIPIFIADTSDEDSILQMTSKAKVIINCCGPYIKYGEVVVKNCVESGTHHIDVSGEAYFHEILYVKYSKAAEEKGVYLIIACGFDSVASEVGLAYLTETFSGNSMLYFVHLLNCFIAGILNSVEIYMIHQNRETATGSYINYGTWESAVNGIGEEKNYHYLHKSRKLSPLPDVKPKLSLRLPFSKTREINKPNKWAIPFPSPDYHVVQSSQRYFYENDKKRPIQVNYYTLLDSWIYALLAIVFGLFFFILCQFQFGKKLLLKYPKIFTMGYVSHERPNEETMTTTNLNMFFYGKGWSEEFENIQDQSTIPPNKSILAKLVVKNPGYGYTCLAATLAAVTLLTETSKLPSKLPFSKTREINKPNKWAIPFPSPDYLWCKVPSAIFTKMIKKRPIQVKYYTSLDSWIYALLAIICGFFFLILCQFQFGKKLLLKYPEIFTIGYVSHKQPNEETMAITNLNMFFCDQSTIPPNKSILAKLVIKNPGYGYTCLAATLAAVTLLTETSKLPSNCFYSGGVMSPSVAFKETTYMNELQKRSNPIEFIEIKDI